LGAAASIDALITSWRREASGRTLSAGAPLADAERAYRVVAWRLRQAIWDPLAPPLAGAAHVFVVPDGQVNVVNLNALPERAGRFLADEPATIHYLTTERDLVPTTNSEARTSLLAVGGATFDGDTLAAPAPTAERSACEAFSRMRFAALPGSRREVAEISRAWPEGDARDVTVLSGAAATETAVKQAVSGRRVVHLATHGFFLGGECIPGLVGTRGVGGLARRTSSASADTDNPLLLSGLALAWANRRDRARDRQDDGILTAEEIAALNLHGTEWAVLSACDTGLGEIKAGEGVFGLRRAFQIAGARTVIMSLWAVEDGAARVWMRALYDGRFRRHFTTSEAVGAASRSVLADRRARGLSTHPFYWAGFVAAGDWR
jgi:CHAT domain-containing protein